MPFEARQAYLSQLQPLSAAVFDRDRAARIRQLILIHPPVELFSYIDKGLSKCDSMTIFQSREEIQTDHTLELLELPCLRRLDLHLRNMLFTFGSETLMGLRNLVIFEIINPRGRAESILQITEPVTLPNVEHFGWCSPDTDMALFSDFFHYIRFPRLRSMRLSVNFFSNLPPTVSSLAFSILDPSMETTTLIHHILHCIPQVSGLQFIQCPTMAIEAALEVVGRPLPSSTLVYDELRRLSITNALNWPWPAAEILDPRKLVEMLEALQNISGERSWERFHFSMSRNITWGDHDPQVLDRLRMLATEERI